MPIANVGRTDLSVLVAVRVVRMFAYGFLSVIPALHLVEIGLEFSAPAIGLWFTSTLPRSRLVSLALTTSDGRVDRRHPAAHRLWSRTG